MIGELDLFQKEHELSTLLAKCQPVSAKTQHLATANGQPMDFPTTGSVHSTDEIDCAGRTKTPYEGQSIGSGSAENGSFNGSFDEDATNNGYENPSFRYLHQQQQQNGSGPAPTVAGSQEIILIQDEELSGNTQKYLQDNSEIVTLRCKDTQRQSLEKNYASIGLGGIGNDNLIVQPGKGRASGAGGVPGDQKGGTNNNNQQQQRLSSFKMDAGCQSPQRSSLNGPQHQQPPPPPSAISTLKRNHSQNYSCDKAAAVDQGHHQQAPGNGRATYSNGNGDLSVVEPTMIVQVSPDGKLRSKPTVSPRPTSLSGWFFFLFEFHYFRLDFCRGCI